MCLVSQVLLPIFLSHDFWLVVRRYRAASASAEALKPWAAGAALRHAFVGQYSRLAARLRAPVSSVLRAIARPICIQAAFAFGSTAVPISSLVGVQAPHPPQFQTASPTTLSSACAHS